MPAAFARAPRPLPRLPPRCPRPQPLPASATLLPADQTVAPCLALHYLGRERARPFNARRQWLGQLCSVDSLAVRSKDVRLPRHTLRVTSLCVGCLAMPAAMAPYRVRRLLLWPCRQPSGEYVPPIPLFRSGDVGPCVDAADEPSHDLPCLRCPLGRRSNYFQFIMAVALDSNPALAQLR